MKKISLPVRKNMLLALALSTASILFSEQSHAQKISSEMMTMKAEVSNKSNSPIGADTSKDVIRIQNNNGNHGIARVYSQSGKKISENILFAGVNAIDVSSLSRGEYIVCVILDGGQTYNQKFNKD